MYKFLIILALIAALIGGFAIYKLYHYEIQATDIILSDCVDSTEIVALSDIQQKRKYYPKYLAIHCTGSVPSKDWTMKDVNRIFKERGFDVPGYHVIINPSGNEIWTYTPNKDYLNYSDIRWGITGINSQCIHIATVSGYGKPTDNRTKAQKNKLIILIKKIKELYPSIKYVQGHRDFLNNNPQHKICPGYSVGSWLKEHEDELNALNNK